MKIPTRQFQGERPRMDTRLLGDNEAQIAENCDVLGGDLRTIMEPLVQSQTIPANQISLYREENGNFLTWSTDVDVAKSPVELERFDRIYFTGDGVPKVRVNQATNFDLGIPQPTLTPTAASVDKEETTWTREWSYFWEEENGDQVDEGTLTEGAEIIETEVGKIFTLTDIASVPKPTASATAFLVLTFVASAANGAGLGVLFPEHSLYAPNTTLVIDGADVTGLQTTTADDATLELVYDTSQSSSFVTEKIYVYTFLSAYGEEGPPSAESLVVAVDPVQDAVITNMDTSAPGNINIAKKRIYRTVTSAAGTEFNFVAEIDLDVSTYTDALADSDTGPDFLKSAGWFAPPATLAGLVSMPGGFLAGFVGQDVYFSEPNQAHAWPTTYIRTVDFDIVGLGVSGNSLVVLTKGFPYLMTGVHPESIIETKITLNQACASKRSITDLGKAVIYASPDGIVMVQDGQAQIVSELFFKIREWRELSPETMIAAVHDQRVHMISDNRFLIFDFEPNRSALTRTDQTAAGMYVNLEDDRLYLIQDQSITSWNEGANALTIRWRGKDVGYAYEEYPTLARVVADGYPMTYKVYADASSTAAGTVTVSNDSAFRLPSIERGKFWSHEVSGDYDVHELLTASDMDDL